MRPPRPDRRDGAAEQPVAAPPVGVTKALLREIDATLPGAFAALRAELQRLAQSSAIVAAAQRIARTVRRDAR